jgi:hypothetical protein
MGTESLACRRPIEGHIARKGMDGDGRRHCQERVLAVFLAVRLHDRP